MTTMWEAYRVLGLVLGLVLVAARLTDGAKILLVPIPMRSHLNLGVQSAAALKEGGHQVWIMGPEEKEASMAKKGFKYLPYDTTTLTRAEDEMGQRLATSLYDSDNTDAPSIFTQMGSFKSINEEMCHKTLQNKALMDAIRQQNFDIAVMGTTMMLSCLYLIPYKFGIPYVTYTPFDDSWSSGVTTMPSFQPSLITSPPVSNEMTFAERLSNAWFYIVYPLGSRYINDGDFQSKFAPKKPSKSLSELQAESLITFLQVDNTCLDYPRLSTPHYRIIGALTPTPAKPLTGEIKAFADGATDGLILITFGSTAIGSAILEGLLPVLKEVAPKIKQRILLQYVSGNDPGVFPKNVRFQSWIPQNDVLGHRNTVAMVSHGGANGQMEAAYHGVPMISLGFTEEQRYNSRRVVEHHYGIWLPLPGFTADDLLQAFVNITTDPSYRQNIRHCSQIMRDMPHAKTALVYWVDHVLQFGGAHLRPSSVDMPFYKLFLLDIWALFLIIVCVLFAALYLVITCACVCARRAFKVKKE